MFKGKEKAWAAVLAGVFGLMATHGIDVSWASPAFIDGAVTLATGFVVYGVANKDA